jgi:hypothetical protein
VPDPIGLLSRRDVSWIDQPSDREDFRETILHRLDARNYGVCGAPTTVIGAALCGDETAVSNACRRAKHGTVDETFCDDLALQKMQDWFARLAEKAVELVLGAKMRQPK